VGSFLLALGIPRPVSAAKGEPIGSYVMANLTPTHLELGGRMHTKV